ncbi:hypothetical protein CDL12_18767 [Handroanthus impetiginosus]|uniref:F-box domain-containing protein n=1 Tax=Handroanthus impetiginosus TaxID=429701 RepID=A0A2G9GTR8_9LAMI|nr:hypothetical protein CDL12_18767 [Handroanthus impetiginosus]
MVAQNDDLLTEILLKLPTKSLIRFKSVCKHWLSLISARRFSHLHALRHPKPQPSLILSAHTSQHFYLRPILGTKKLISYHFSLPKPKILSSCNGLLLLQSDNHQKDYYVYNPTTKQSRKITLTDNNNYAIVLGLRLAFGSSKSPHYKIVCIRATRKSSSVQTRCCQIEVYDSQSRGWELCLESFTASIHVKFDNGVHYNNNIHWENYPSAHLYFDIDKNITGNLPYAQTPWPEGGGGAACHCQLQESNGHLHHFIIVSDNGDKSVAVFELHEDYSEWLLKYNDRFGRVPGKFRILSFNRGDDEEKGTLAFHVPGKIMGCAFHDKSFKELVDLRNQVFYKEDAVLFRPHDVHQFGETLVPV